ncbi:MAG: glutamine synthetase [Myxococcota bacterium]|jgi:glutamine synthetase
MTPQRRTDYLIEAAQKGRVAFIQLWLTDIHGRVRGVTIPTAQLEVALDEGITVSSHIITGDLADAEELTLVPDPQTWAVLPWSDESGVVARLICDTVGADGSPSRHDGRTVLKRMLGRAHDVGYTFYCGAALEHGYLSATQPIPVPLTVGPECGFGATRIGQALVQQTVVALEQLGCGVHGFATARGAGQFRVELAFSDPLALADRIVTHRHVVCELARQHAMSATFMPFPFRDQPRHGMTLAVSLYDAGESAFRDADGDGAPTAIAAQFADGLSSVAHELALVTRSTVNSYNRSLRNAPVQIPSGGTLADEGRSLLFEQADASANPYLLIAAVLEAGLAAVPRPVGAAPEDAQPVTLVAAADIARHSELLQHVLGEELLATLVDRAHSAAAEYRKQVTGWELERYLDVY